MFRKAIIFINCIVSTVLQMALKFALIPIIESPPDMPIAVDVAAPVVKAVF